MKGFKEFIMRPTLIDMAVGLVMALALKELVSALIMPLVGILFGKPSFDHLSTTINGSELLWGSLVTAIVAFVSLGFGVYFFVVKPYQMYQDRQPKEPEEPPAVDEQLELLREIRDGLQNR
jgi:large conductance mechanosensitive channel